MIKILVLIGFVLILIGFRPEKNNPQNQVSKNKTNWICHVDSLLMPFWMSDEALGDPPGNYPAYRYEDGSIIDFEQIDFSTFPTEFLPFFLEPTDSLRRDFIRVKSRQIYVYCVAFHITGNEEYLANARFGLDYLINNGVYSNGSAVTFWDKDGTAKPGILQRNTQDLAYALLGPTIYYYLTRDPEILNIILKVSRFVWEEYYEKSELWENTKLMSFVREDFEVDSIHHENLLAPLDQLNAYLLLMARIVPDSLTLEFIDRVQTLAYSIKENFYDENFNIFWGNLNKKELDGNSDFAHSIKTFWMLYTTAKLTKDKNLEDFSRIGAEKLLSTAFLEKEGRWASKYLNEKQELDKNTMAWHDAELDQMAATLSFSDTSFYMKYLARTYPYFEKYMIDHENKETYWGRRANGEIMEVGFKTGWHRAGFHSLEHALIGYMSTANYYGDDIELYFAFKKSANLERTKIKPYHYDAEFKNIVESEFKNPLFSNLIKIRVTFDKIN